MLPVPPMVPLDAVQMTAVLALFTTAAENCWVPPAPIVASAGDRVIPIGVTVTVADALLETSAELVAVMVNGPPPSGAVYVAFRPAPTMVPPLAVHVARLLLELLAMVALNESVAPAFTVLLVGEMAMVTGGGGATGSLPPLPQAATVHRTTSEAADRRTRRGMVYINCSTAKEGTRRIFHPRHGAYPRERKTRQRSCIR